MTREMYKNIKAFDRCVACDYSELQVFLKYNYCDVYKCKRCGHLQINHKCIIDSVEYHNQNENDPFIQSLKTLRIQQANVILNEIKSLGLNSGIVDFGCGRGWFIDECLKNNFKYIFAVDYSDYAIENAKNKGALSYKITDKDIGTNYSDLSKKISIDYSILVFLDVIEHFNSDIIFENMQNIIENSNLEYIIIKVPDSSGILFGLAYLLSKFKIYSPINQLFQVKTYPPHYQYFNKKSMNSFSEKLDITLIKVISDNDVILDKSFFDRINFTVFIPKYLVLIFMKISFRLFNLFGKYDSRIYLFKKNKRY